MDKAEPQRRELTDRFVKTVKQGLKRTRYWDTRQRGLVLQVEPSGHKAWKVAYRHLGKLEWYSLGRADKAVGDRVEHTVGLKEARKAAREAMAWVALGKSPHAERRALMGRASAAVTFQAACDRYLKEHAKASRRAASMS